MKNCPNCNEQIKETYKFCPSCKTTILDFKPKKKALSSNEKMVFKYCSECGNKMNQLDKFCVKCGNSTSEKKTDNKIDNSLNKVKNRISSISNDISESETVTTISNNVKNVAKETKEKAEYAGNKFLSFLGILGFIIIILMIAYPLVTGNDFVLKSAYDYNLGENKNSYAGFIGEITAPILLPLIFIYLGFRKNRTIVGCMFWPLLIGMIITMIVIMN